MQDYNETRKWTKKEKIDLVMAIIGTVLASIVGTMLYTDLWIIGGS